MANDALEQSLRAEIDKHFNARLNQLRAEMDRIQDSLNETVTRHKAETDTIMSKMMEKISVEDEAMNAVIAEHLRNAEAAAAESAARAASEAAAEQAAREALEREAAERAAREAAEQFATEQAAAREAAEKLAQEQAAAKEAAEQAAREAAEQAAAEHAAREAAEQAAREASERAAQEAAAREAAERAAQEAAEKLATEQAAVREAAERLAQEQAAAKEAAEKLAQEQAAAREAAERAAREAAEAAEAEASAVKQEAKKISAENISLLRNAIIDLSKQKTQAEILKTLVGYAGSLAPRVAFFVVKEGYTKGWRAFGLESTIGNDAITHIVLPLTDHTPLGEAVQNQSAWDGTPGQHQDDYKLIKGLGGLTPKRMVAIPLVARNRSVAVLYADSGDEDADNINVDALDSLTHVAAINVEILAAARSTVARPQPTTVTTQQQQYAPQTEAVSQSAAPAFDAPVEETAPTGPLVTPPTYAEEPVSEPVAEEPPPQEAVQPAYEEPVHQQQAVPIVTAQPAAAEERSFDLSGYQSKPVEAAPVTPVQTYVPVETPVVERQTFTPVPTQPAATVTTPPTSSYGGESRFRRRDIDLPIEVSEDERRFHNEARRFARLLVSEIKLYNEPKVKEGREYGDLYDRLREAIDRSREMYDKRVSPQVASKFDYFNYELVNTLAEGDESKLGSDYPGASV